jgi:predicted Kef-type K+ transport protein
MTVGNWAFHDCRSLTSLTIGSSVTNIGNFAFARCGGLTEIINLNPTPQNITVEGEVFLEMNLSPIRLKVPSGSVDAYKAATVWSEFGNIESIN